MISGPANDDCGAATATAAAGITLVKKERRSDSPPLTENAAVDDKLKRRVTLERKDFMVVASGGLGNEIMGEQVKVGQDS